MIFENCSLRCAPNIRNENSNICLTPQEIKSSPVPKGSGVETYVYVLKRKGRIQKDVARLMTIGEQNELHAAWRRRICTRFHFLAGSSVCKNRDQEQLCQADELHADFDTSIWSYL